MLKITGYIWIAKYVWKNLHRHNVTMEEVKQVLRNSPQFFRKQRGKMSGEDLYSAVGQIDSGRYLVVFFIRKADGRALPISARDLTAKEKHRYAKSRK